jgi:hypothetical protein
VTLTAAYAGISVEGATDGDGNHTFAQITPGNYSVTVAKVGFATCNAA